jgi:hypothetical protein
MIGRPGDVCLLWNAEVRGARISGFKATTIEQGYLPNLSVWMMKPEKK